MQLPGAWQVIDSPAHLCPAAGELSLCSWWVMIWATQMPSSAVPDQQSRKRSTVSSAAVLWFTHLTWGNAFSHLGSQWHRSPRVIPVSSSCKADDLRPQVGSTDYSERLMSYLCVLSTSTALPDRWGGRQWGGEEFPQAWRQTDMQFISGSATCLLHGLPSLNLRFLKCRKVDTKRTCHTEWL